MGDSATVGKLLYTFLEQPSGRLCIRMSGRNKSSPPFLFTFSEFTDANLGRHPCC